MTHEQRLEDEYAKVSVLQVEREAGKRVIDSLHREAIMWMHRCHNLPFGRRETRGSRVRLPREEGARSRHQCLFKENVGKTETCGLRTLSVKGSRVVYARGRY